MISSLAVTVFPRGVPGVRAVTHDRMPYWSVPAEVADDEDLLREWAKRAIDGLDR